jgi:carboxyl-terminal processing protease
LSGITPDIELAFVSPNEKESTAPSKMVREEDLERHMEKEPDQPEQKAKEVSSSPEEQQAKTLLDRDNQARHAFELLKTWSVFSKIKTNP